MSTEESRAEFEAYYTRYVAADTCFDRYDDPDTPGRWYYVSPPVEAARHLWEAARSTAPALKAAFSDKGMPATIKHDLWQACKPKQANDPEGELRWQLSCFADKLIEATTARAAEPTEAQRQQIIAEFLERTGQYVTNDASREAAIAEAIAVDRAGGVTLDEFKHWLNDRRSLDVSMVFHEIVDKFAALTHAAGAGDEGVVYGAMLPETAYARQSADAHSDLRRFYDVANDAELIEAQARHIERLQSKLPALRDEQPRNPRKA